WEHFEPVGKAVKSGAAGAKTKPSLKRQLQAKSVASKATKKSNGQDAATASRARPARAAALNAKKIVEDGHSAKFLDNRCAFIVAVFDDFENVIENEDKSCFRRRRPKNTTTKNANDEKHDVARHITCILVRHYHRHQ
ncbi:MAG: hypothetical protein P4L61_01420, partial [Candidatus Pacebacteria bacterium]|nr:hypothetical protein [Candidatus Paceibacterota bacterium]